jgi:hypothetical protein
MGPDLAVEHSVVVVAHDVGLVGAMEVVVGVRGRRLHAPEKMDELVRLDRRFDAPPAAAVDSTDEPGLASAVVRIVGGRAVVRLHRGKPAEAVLVHPDEVATVGPVEAL